ncbi:MAG: hypothetical protein KAX39_08310 [candidate division Zixibacteria bacterium]|nr:hypothetical protein [candidate division Zixibacteria bacterium]
MLTMIALEEQTDRVAEQLPMVNAYLEKDVRRTTKKVLTVFASLILITFGGISAVILLSTFLYIMCLIR